ncbi:MAG: zinc ribbon domain-containing protein, partial [Muribaculaceae bacterium]|nr:zinc ribbon domain-containing protein [Muribaculaceae bacterium]
MAICKKCGNNLDDSAKFCVNCGTPVSAEPQASTPFCTNCGAKLEPGVKFCTECGSAVESAGAGQPAAQGPSVPVVPPVVLIPISEPTTLRPMAYGVVWW